MPRLGSRLTAVRPRRMHPPEPGPVELHPAELRRRARQGQIGCAPDVDRQPPPVHRCARLGRRRIRVAVAVAGDVAPARRPRRQLLLVGAVAPAALEVDAVESGDRHQQRPRLRRSPHVRHPTRIRAMNRHRHEHLVRKATVLVPSRLQLGDQRRRRPATSCRPPRPRSPSPTAAAPATPGTARQHPGTRAPSADLRHVRPEQRHTDDARAVDRRPNSRLHDSRLRSRRGAR